MDPTRFATWLPIAVGAGFVLLSLRIAWQAWRTVYRSRTWTPVQGEVVSVAQERRSTPRAGDSGSDVRYVLVAHYRFRHPQTGAMIEGQDDLGDVPASAGSPIDLVYRPTEPARSMIPKPKIGGAACTTVVLIGFLLLGAAAIAVGVLMRTVGQ